MAGCASCGRELSGPAVVADGSGGWRKADDTEIAGGDCLHPSCAAADDPAAVGLLRGYVTPAPA